jgi:hypothetical protein
MSEKTLVALSPFLGGKSLAKKRAKIAMFFILARKIAILPWLCFFFSTKNCYFTTPIVLF